ncbi:MAG: ROK family protein [Limisphaerales bacterium]
MKISLQQMADIEAEILKQVRAHPGISRIALARKLQIAPSTVGNYAERLITEGFLIDSEKTDQEAGRPPTALRLNPDGGQFIGVDFEARNIMAMAVDFSDRPLRQVHKDIEKSDSVQDIIEKIEQAITEVLPDDQGRLLAIGVGVPGLVDPDKGIAVHYKYIKDWQNVSLAAPLAKQFGVPVYLENNARSMALAELWFGQGRGLKDWLCVGMRSGVGAGIVSGGQLQHGANHRAGEIGCWLCPKSPRAAARFFTSGCSPMAEKMELQEVSSVRAILAALERVRQSGEKSFLSVRNEPITFTDVVHAARLRDRLAVQVIEVAAEMLGWAVGELALALNPSQVILTGPLTLLGEIMLHPLRHQAEEILQASGAEVPTFVNSTMGEYSGALGAAALAVEEWKPVR